MITELGILLALILLNGVFALSEIAIVAARRARLVQMAKSGSRGATRALALKAEPTRFLSSVQVGITAIGILSGAIGEASVASRLRTSLDTIPPLAPYVEPLSLAVMVVGLTYVSLILGELVPKRLALTHPERLAALIAAPMQFLARIGRPIVHVLSVSTDAIFRLTRMHLVKRPTVTPEEIEILLAQGAEEGVFERTEHELVTNILNLDERHVGAVLTPRSEVVYLDVRDSPTENRERLRKGPHTVLPLCDGGLDHVLGFVRSTRVLEQLLEGRPLDLATLAEPALFVPETMTLVKLLERFKQARLPVALAVDEFGDVAGLVSLTDVTTSIVGDLPPEPGEEPPVVRRDDGSWLMDGGLDLDSLGRTLGASFVLSDAERHQVHTLGGLAMLALGRVPRTGDVFERSGFRFEVVDMDGNRVDRLLVGQAMRPAKPSDGDAGKER